MIAYNVHFNNQLCKFLRTQQLLVYIASSLQLRKFQDIPLEEYGRQSTLYQLVSSNFKYANWITRRNASRLTKTESSEQNSCVYFTDIQYELSEI